jgi:zinc protease
MDERLATRRNSADRRFHFEQKTLDNGLRVIVHPDAAAPLVATHLMYHVGSRHEPPGRRGFAHLFEHLLFQGSQHVPEGEHFRYIQAAGGTLNGTTWFDRTNYYETLPSGELDLALWLESDRMGFFLPAITQEKLDNQRDVVKNERRQSYENRPYGRAVETMLERAFPAGHPYRHPTIGYMADIDAATLDDTREWFESWYGPNNAVLVISGAVEPSFAFDRAAHWFGDIASRRLPEAREVPEITAGVAGEAVILDRVTVPRVYLMFHAPPFPDPGFEPADVLCSLLAEGKSSRLYRELVYERRIAADVSAFVWPTECAGMLWLVATARPGTTAAELQSAVAGVLEALRVSGPAEREIEGARNRARRQLLRQLDSVTRRADLLAHATVLRGEPDYINRVAERYESITPVSVAAAARTILDPARRTAVHVLPEKED